MDLSFLKNISKEKKYFLIFLLVHFIVWTCIGLIRTVLPTDSLEGIYWGYLHDFGTPKHPPLAGWLTYLAYIPFKHDISIYILSQGFILIGFIYIYKLAKFFLDDTKSMLAVIVMEGCWVYSYITGYYGFNPDVILLGMLPMITYYFYRCMTENKGINWIILGVLVGISLLNKYQTGMVIVPMAVYAAIFKRDTFKNIYFYLSMVIALLIFLPHILWLINYDFFPFMYFEGELSSPKWYSHLTAPLMFLFMQFVVIAGVLVIFGIMKFVSKSKYELIKDYDNKDFWFLIILGLVPNLIHLIMGFVEGGNMRPRWGFVFWYMTGIMLFYFFPTIINNKEFKTVLKSAYAVMLIIFLSLGTLLTVEKNYRSRYPVSTIYGDMQRIWTENQTTPLKYIGGYIEWTLPLTIYGKSHPDCILDTFGYKNPWIDEEDLKKKGAVFIDRNQFLIEDEVRKGCPYISKETEIIPVEYKFIVHNALKMPREYTIYYYMVAPQN